MLGIDLGVKNMGVYSPYLGYRTYSMETNFFELADCLMSLVYQNVAIVDFDFRINYWPGNKQTKTYLIFLAGCIYSSADIAHFVTPKEIREFLGFSALVKKQELHRIANILYPENEAKNSHELDAYLLYKFGEKMNYESN